MWRRWAAAELDCAASRSLAIWLRCGDPSRIFLFDTGTWSGTGAMGLRRAGEDTGLPGPTHHATPRVPTAALSQPRTSRRAPVIHNLTILNMNLNIWLIVGGGGVLLAIVNLFRRRSTR
jgi:hypothetical protein